MVESVPTLQGWWSVPHPYSSISGFVGGDRDKRWFFCMDWGNSGNHRGSDHGKKANYGVTSYWHVDGGSLQAPVALPNTTPVGPTWLSIADTGSAWCGLRAHGDVAAVDAVTGNAYNSTLVQNYGDNHFRQVDQQNPSGYSDANYPGYGSQWDQMLYRDFTADGSGNVTVSFSYRTAGERNGPMPTSRGGRSDGCTLRPPASARQAAPTPHGGADAW